MGNTEAAFAFYKTVFGTEYSTPLMRMGDVPPDPGNPPLADDEKNLVMHVALPTLGDHEIMGTDMLKSMGHELKIGNNITINLEPDSLEETQRLYKALSEGGADTDNMELQKMFWGAWWGTCLDKFGIRWMFNYQAEPMPSKS
jgi:PhnB protein